MAEPIVCVWKERNTVSASDQHWPSRFRIRPTTRSYGQSFTGSSAGYTSSISRYSGHRDLHSERLSYRCSRQPIGDGPGPLTLSRSLLTLERRKLQRSQAFEPDRRYRCVLSVIGQKRCRLGDGINQTKPDSKTNSSLHRSEEHT